MAHVDRLRRSVRAHGPAAAIGVPLLLLGSLASARPLSEKVTERVVTTAVDESLEALEREENLQRLGNILSSEPVRDGVHRLSASIGAGMVDGMVESANKNGMILEAGDIRGLLEKQVAPAAGTVTRHVVNAAAAAALSEHNAKRAGHFGELVTRGVVRGLAEGLEQDLGPALARTLVRDLGPAMGSVLRDDVVPSIGVGLVSDPMQHAVALTIDSIANHIVHGADTAIDEVKAEDLADDTPSGLTLFGNRVALGSAVALAVALVFVSLLLIVLVFLVRTSRRQRELEQQGRNREVVMLELLEQLGREHPTMKTDLEQLIRDQLSEREVAGPA